MGQCRDTWIVDLIILVLTQQIIQKTLNICSFNRFKSEKLNRKRSIRQLSKNSITNTQTKNQLSLRNNEMMIYFQTRPQIHNKQMMTCNQSMSLTIRQIIGISMLIYNMQLRIAKEKTMLIILPSVEINTLFRYSLIINCRIIAKLLHLKDKFHIIFLYSSLHLIFPHNKDTQMKKKLSRNRLTASGNRKLFNLLLLN